MNKWKGFFNGVKKGSLSAVTEANVFVVTEPKTNETPYGWSIATNGTPLAVANGDTINFVDGKQTTVTINGKDIAINLKGREAKLVQDTTYLIKPEDFTSKVLNFVYSGTTVVSVDETSVAGLTDADAELYMVTSEDNKLVFDSLNPTYIAVTNSPDKLPESYPNGYCFITGVLGPIDAAVASFGALHYSGDLNYTTSTFTPKRGTVVITADTLLTAVDHDQMTLICKNTVDINITIPTGLGADFDCNVVTEAIGTKWVNFVQGAGTTLIAPHGTKLLTDYTANITKRTDAEIFNLQGELTP